jgi:hypothetical protein
MSSICHAFHEKPQQVRPNDRKFAVVRLATGSRHPPKRICNLARRIGLAKYHLLQQSQLRSGGHPENLG